MSTPTARFAVFIAAGALALGACERAPDAPVDAPASDAAPTVEASATSTDTVGEIDATRVVDRASVAGSAADFDVKAFAGAFATEGANLHLASDGTYTLVVHAESADADLSTTGTWTVEANGAELLLDPDGKDEPDRRYAITSNDALTAVDGGQVLRRDGA
ncbi:MAG TPA: copper resistance protein NlpE N-terminal domain-containing protein [Xanthomonadaceae bacterium]|nr:copper resistance protein NlpE N-terminal domain-containing protein [Xanthomonadaceae bacterium]